MHQRYPPSSRNWRPVLALAAIIACGATLTGCYPSSLPVAPYSNFGDPAHSSAYFSSSYGNAGQVYDETVNVTMAPIEYPFGRRVDLSIQRFRSPTDSAGRARIDYPKGSIRLRLLACQVRKSRSDMLYEWDMVQKKKVVQHMQVRVVPGPPVRVFVNDQEISVSGNWE